MKEYAGREGIFARGVESRGGDLGGIMQYVGSLESGKPSAQL